MPLWWEVTRWVLTALGLYTGAFWVLGWIYSGHPGWPGKHDKPNMYDLSRSSAAMAGILGGAAAIAVALRRQRSTEKSVRIAADAQQTSADAQQTAARAQEIAAAAQKVDADAYRLDLRRTENDRVTALRNRYTEAARQLGDPSAAVRLAGAYAMAALADDWITRNEEVEENGGEAWIRDPDAQACIDVLCAYLRTPRRHPGDRRATDPTDEGEDTEYRADREVRQTIIRITRDHLRGHAPIPWAGFDLDYTNAVFQGEFDMTGAEFTAGRVAFDHANFTNGRFSFDRTTINGGDVSFKRAVVDQGADVTWFGAQIAAGQVSFEEAQLNGRLDFRGVQMLKPDPERDHAELSFMSATITGTIEFSSRHTELAGGEISFVRAQLEARAKVMFDRIQITGGLINFERSNLAGGLLTFHAMDLLGGEVSLGGASFEGTLVQFQTTQFNGGAVSFGWVHPLGSKSLPRLLSSPAFDGDSPPRGPWTWPPPWDGQWVHAPKPGSHETA